MYFASLLVSSVEWLGWPAPGAGNGRAAAGPVVPLVSAHDYSSHRPLRQTGGLCQPTSAAVSYCCCNKLTKILPFKLPLTLQHYGLLGD